MKVTSEIRWPTWVTPTFCPAKTWLRFLLPFEADAAAMRHGAIGAGIGSAIACIGLTAADQRYDDSVYVWLHVGSWLLPAMGASVGAATGGGKTPFVPAGRTARVTSISPWLAPDDAGLALAIRY
jgi:hypothetical protein